MYAVFCEQVRDKTKFHLVRQSCPCPAAHSDLHAGVALLARGLYPVDLPSVKNPDFIDVAFDNRAVLWAARLLLVSAAAVLAFGGLFIVISIGIRIKNGEWLRRAGPFEVSETT